MRNRIGLDIEENISYEMEDKWFFFQGKLQKRDKSKQVEGREREWKIFGEEMQRYYLKLIL